MALQKSIYSKTSTLAPADSYVVINKSIITEIDKKILIDLYQPVIGNKAISFYYTLLNDLEKSSFMSDTFTHHHLQTVMQISLNDIIIAREKLEAIGLLKTYIKRDHINSYLYVLYSPIPASEFLNHPLLSVVLYNNIGKKEYQNILNTYKLPKVFLKDYDDITKSFNDVFSTVPSDSYITNSDLVSKNTNKLKFDNFFDIELLFEGLLDTKITEKAFTKEVIDLIINLSFIYNLDVLTMQNIIKANISEKGVINKEDLRKSARNYYQFEHSGNLPTVIYSKQPEYLKTPSGDSSKKAMMIYTFENAHPYQLLKSKYKDGKVVIRDLKLIESLLIDLKLSPGVVNVLIDYVLKVNNQKLNKNYVETIASQWKRLGIETVPEAMEACKKEHRKLFKQSDKNIKINPKKEISVPEWFNKNIEKQEVTKEEEEKLKMLLSSYK